MDSRDIVFSPVTIGGIELKSRLIRSATEMFFPSPDGSVDKREEEFFRALSTEPVGMIITAHTCVSPEGRSNAGQNLLDCDERIEDAARLRRAAGEVPVILQLGHGGMKGEGSNGGRPVYTPDNMTKEQIDSTVKAFGAAAKRAKDAGYEGMMLHGAHLYLLSQFFYPEFNHRTDSYGGRAENRFRIVREAAEEIHAVCGDDYPVFLKINGDDRVKSEEYHRDVEKALEISAKCGICAVEISGWHSSLPGSPKAPYFLENVRRYAKVSPLPLIEVGGMRSADDIKSALDAGAVAASASRPFLRDPHFASKLRDIEGYRSDCVGCGYCYRQFGDGRNSFCARKYSL